MKTSRTGIDWSDAFFGTATVGERGQVVIPADARAEMDMKPGDKVLVMRHPVHHGLVLFKFEAVREFLDSFQAGLEKLEGMEAREEHS